MNATAHISSLIRSGLEPLRGRLIGYRIFLFGSRAAHCASSQSDFDIGIDGANHLPRRLLHAVQDMLESLPTLHTFDLVDFTRAAQPFRKIALKKTEPLL